MITINPRPEDVKIVVIGKTPCWEAVAHSNSFWEEAARVELNPS